MKKKRILYRLTLVFLFGIIIYNVNYIVDFFYLMKDIVFDSVSALVNDKETKMSGDLSDCIISGLQDDIDNLLRLNNMTESLSNFNYVNATVIERNREYWFNSLTINKGKDDGINLDMAVIDENGLIGRINSITNKTATVKLLTTNDTKNKISALILNGDEKIYGIINGYDSKNNLLNLVITNNSEVLKNSKVMTTGMGGVFPSNILIGTVNDTIKDDDGITKIVRIVPSGNVEGERYVSVLQRKKISNS